MVKTRELSQHGFRTNNRTYVIAEIGINHGGDEALAEDLIESAAGAGVDAVKFQTYLTEKRAPQGNQEIFDILKGCELPFPAFERLKRHSEVCGVQFFSTPFDRESVECLESIDVDLHKVASFDVVNHALLRELAATGKPVIMSTGMADREEIREAYQVLRSGTDAVAILHCVSSYPLREEDANLAALYALQETFDCVIGYSDHTPGIEVPLMAVAAGAQVIEKHFRIDEAMDCVDAPVSITAAQTAELVDQIRRYERVFGTGELGVGTAEEATLVFRRPSR